MLDNRLSVPELGGCTVNKWLKLGKARWDLKTARTRRNWPDPFEEEWPEIVQRQRDEPESEANALFEDPFERHLGRYHPNHVRTFQSGRINPRAVSLVDLYSLPRSTEQVLRSRRISPGPRNRE